MKLHRFIGNYDLLKKEVEIVNPETIKQIKGVLRLKISDLIILSDGKGFEAEAVITEISPNRILCVINQLNKTSELKRKVNLYLAILKKENFELAVQKAVETGVATITPVLTERTIKTGLNITRLEKIILEASEQCGRSTVPTLSPILEFSPAIAFASAAEEKVIFTPSFANDRVHLVDAPYTPNKKAKSVSIFVGPEGGFTDKEIKLAEAAGFTPSSLGPLTLRGETAAIIGTYLAVNSI